MKSYIIKKMAYGHTGLPAINSGDAVIATRKQQFIFEQFIGRNTVLGNVVNNDIDPTKLGLYPKSVPLTKPILSSSVKLKGPLGSVNGLQLKGKFSIAVELNTNSVTVASWVTGTVEKLSDATSVNTLFVC